jgi:hypothetical protein
MRYWFDTEFIEKDNYIDLISIGIVAENGFSYYAICNEFNEKNACEWVRSNVLNQLDHQSFWKSKRQIKDEITKFVKPSQAEFWVYNGAYDWVIFCQIFNGIRNLPKGYPWYANDIKQLSHMIGLPQLPVQKNRKHHALDDAIWTKQAYEFLMQYKDYYDQQRLR